MTKQQNQNIAPAPTTTPGVNPTTSTSQELVIYLDHEIGILEYRGTRSMLEGEGAIPANFKWPAGYDELYWESGNSNTGFSASAQRALKGHAKIL